MRYRLIHKGMGRGGLIASIAIHVVVILLFAQMVFQYPIGALVGFSEAAHIKPEKIEFVHVAPPPPPASSQSARPKAARRGGAPAPLIAPSAIPTQIPQPIPEIKVPSQAAGGTGNGLGVVGGMGAATGVIPALPDARIKVTPQGYFMMPSKTPAEKIDSIVADLYGDYLDSLEATSHERKPGDWTFTTKDGKKYGWNQQGIQLGKFMIPNALFALLPLKIQENPTTYDRFEALREADIMYQGNLQITEDEFRQAIKRIRARDEKIHEAKERAKRAAADSSSHE